MKIAENAVKENSEFLEYFTKELIINKKKIEYIIH